MPVIFDEEKKTKGRVVFDEEEPTSPPPTTPTGLTSLDASATPTIDEAESQPKVDSQLLGDLTTGGYAPPPRTPSPPSGPIDLTQLGLDSAEAGLTTAGLILGAKAGVAAAPMTGGTSAILLPAAGAILGYGIGKSGSNLLARALGKKAPLNDLPEAFQEIGETLKEGAETEIYGNALGAAPIAVAKKVIAPLAKSAVAGGQVAMENIAKAAEKFGMKLTPAEITQSKGLSLLENFLSNVPFSAGKLQKFRLDQLKQLAERREKIIEAGGGEKALEEVGLKMRGMVDDVVKDFNNFSENNLARLKDRVMQKIGSRETYHDLIQPLQAVNAKNIENLRTTKNTLYKNAADLMPDDLSQVPENFVGAATRFRDEILKATPQLQDKTALKVLDSIINNPTPMTAEQIVANRRALNDLRQKSTNFITGEMDNSARMYAEMVDALDNDMTALAQSTGNDTIIQAQSIANKANADYKNYLKDPLVKKIAESKKPDAIVASVYSPGNDTEIKKFQQYYGKDFSERAKKVFTNSLLGLHADPGLPEKALTGDVIRGQMQRYGSTLRTIYSDAEIGYMRRIADVLDGRAEAGKEIVSNPLFKQVLGSSKASGIVDVIVKPRDVGNIALVKQYVGEKGMNEVRNGLLNKLLVKNQHGEFAPQTFAKTLNSYEDRVLREVFPEDVLKDLRVLQNVAARAGGAEKLAGNPSGTARNLLIPVGIGFMLNNPLTTGALLLGSRAFTELYLSPVGRKWLTTGFTLPAVSSQASKVAAKIMMLTMQQQQEKLDRESQGE